MNVGKIEHDIEIPDSFLEGRNIYPFNEMQIGDSFLVLPETEDESLRLYNNVQAAASMYAKRNNVKFSARRETIGIRIWRVK